MEKSDLVGECCEELMKKMKVGKKRAMNPGLGLGSGVVRFTRSMSGKRIAISSKTEADSPAMKKQCAENSAPEAIDKSQLEALPQDVLVKVLCGVDHDDLKQLFQVSKPIREATLIAKKWHFAYSTPRKTLLHLRNSIDLVNENDAKEINAPNAPKQDWAHRPRLSEKRLAGITVALFA